jgi:hypothetical protein
MRGQLGEAAVDARTIGASSARAETRDGLSGAGAAFSSRGVCAGVVVFLRGFLFIAVLQRQPDALCATLLRCSMGQYMGTLRSIKSARIAREPTDFASHWGTTVATFQFPKANQ